LLEWNLDPSRPPPRSPRWPFAGRALLLATLLTGCAEKSPSQLGFDVSFVCPSDRDVADTLTLEVREGGCDGAPVYRASTGRGGSPKAAEGLKDGSYGFYARASRAGAEVAKGCVEAALPSDNAPSIRLASDSCSEGLNGTDLDASTLLPAPGTFNDTQGPDAAVPDAGQAGKDASASVGPPPVCPADCSDPDPCTDDKCENGVCVHTPFTGMRECDRIDCTRGDQCVSGVCNPGTANDSACPDDGDPCTAETCIAGAGCNRSPAEGAHCDDNIGGTANDVCHAGICRGADSCGAGHVCSAVSGMCIGLCTSESDCDDNNPCTVDKCVSGACQRNPSTGNACNDGIGCTEQDTCVGGVCHGTSTCPGNAECAGTTCRCPASTTLCGNTCADLTTSAASCGVCDRACDSSQICENGACKPAQNAGNCTARRAFGHDYLFCTNASADWTTARDRCRAFGMGLVQIDNAAENAFVFQRIAAKDTWIGANDRGNEGDNCQLADGTAGEGHWYWSSATQTMDQGVPLCSVSGMTAELCELAAGAYQNWGPGQPDNSGCGCLAGVCVLGQDCGVMLGTNGTWDDGACGTRFQPYVCESP
jgi:hypothetical protein